MRDAQDGRADLDELLPGTRNRPNDRDSKWRIRFIVVACRFVNKRRDIPVRLRNQLTIIAPKKSSTTVIAPNTFKPLKRKTKIVTHSTIRAQLPAIQMTAEKFGLPENRRVGSKKNMQRKMPRIQKAFTASRAGIRKTHEMEIGRASCRERGKEEREDRARE